MMPPHPLIATLDDAVEALYNLNVSVVGQGSDRHERPHKACLLLAVLDLLARGSAVPDRIPWSPILRDRFGLYFEMVRTPLDQRAPELPFLHLKSEGWWIPWQGNGPNPQPLVATPTVGDAKDGTVFASLLGGMERFVLSAVDRFHLRHALVTRYFPRSRGLLLPLFAEGAGNLPPEETSNRFQEDPSPSIPGRSSAFRRKILEIYDCQCAACGLRIRLPEVDGLTFVDAAHLIPFEQNQNDHPTNGIALCKNHHWAMDRFLIAPTPDLAWIVSPHLLAHRSDGEKSLLALQGQRVLPPHERAFAPSRESLQWRMDRLLA